MTTPKPLPSTAQLSLANWSASAEPAPEADRPCLSRQLCVATTRAPMPMTTGWQWLRRHCWRHCTWVYSRDRGKQPMHTVQQIAHTPCMPSRGKRQRILSLINEQVTTADKGESHTANPVSRRWKQKDLSWNLPADKALSDVTCPPTPQLCKLRFVFFTNQAMIWLHVLSNIKDSLHNEGNVSTA